MPDVIVRMSEQVTGRPGPLYIVVHSHGKRERIPQPGLSREEVETKAELMRKRIERGMAAVAREIVTFKEARDRYVADGTRRLKDSTREDHERLLEGSMGEHFAPFPLVDIGAMLDGWWASNVAEKSKGTGNNYLSALSAVFRYHNRLASPEDRVPNPVLAFRESLASEPSTAQDRADEDHSRDIRAIQDPLVLERLVVTASDAPEYLAVLLMLDAGLRSAEVGGLRWERVWWGKDGTDTTRHLEIAETKPRGRHSPTPKSGRRRKVALSRRARLALLERWTELGQPAEGLVVPWFNGQNFSRRVLPRITKIARAGRWRPKDLRSTYASWLLSLGFPLSYVQGQLGHARADTTERHYARYLPDGYLAPPALKPGELPADCIARLSQIVGATHATDTPQWRDAEADPGEGEPENRR